MGGGAKGLGYNEEESQPPFLGCPPEKPTMQHPTICRMWQMFRFSALLIAMFAGAAAADPIDFNRDIRPILAENCYQCHGPDEQTREAELRLDQRVSTLDSSGIVVPGKPDESLLIERITASDPAERMPPEESKMTLTAEQQQLLHDWVVQGAPWQEHWSLEPVTRPDLPPPVGKPSQRNPIDRFIHARLSEHDLVPSAPASKERLLRRVSLDLTGLPPTPEEVNAFLQDGSERAYENVVDRLLASPHYGERMAWNWLDAARYADSNGYQGDPERTMWPWRDWVVQVLNANLPFDRFTREQLAGDLLADKTLDTQIATGFNRNNMHNGEGGRIPEESRVENVMDRAETVATVWLGITLTCCRCHDHKYDPLTTKDYYRFYAFFNNTSETGAGRSGQMAPTVTFQTEKDTANSDRLQEAVARAIAPLALRESAEKADEKRPDQITEILKLAMKDRNSGQLEKLVAHFKPLEPDYAALLETLREAVQKRDQFLAGLPKVMVMDTLSEMRETFILSKGAYDKPGEGVSPGIPENLYPLPSGTTTDRRDLTEWLLAEQNPLTARVIVNRYWQLFFGKGLVTTPEDFGIQGRRPTHPQLLDWLASEFRQTGWDVKRLHRLIVTSATYRQSSRLTPAQREADPENRLLGRGPRQRLPSWMLRDQALAASGLLVDHFGGPSVKPYQPENIWREATFGKKKYVLDSGENLYRRSLYTFWRRIVGPTMFFDTSRRQTCHVTATVTNTPLHALTTLNDVTFVEAARALAERVMLRVSDNPREQLRLAFRLATAREPTQEELRLLVERYATVRQLFAAQPEEALKLLATGNSERDPRLDPVQHASCAALCSLILNLDETLTKE